MDEHTKEKVHLKNKHTDWSLGLISFTESSFLPILADPFLVAMILARPKKWVRYVMVTTVTSVLGGLFGYLIGAVFFDLFGAKVIAVYHLEGVFEKAIASFDSNAFYFTLVGAFTPIPYKIIAIVGGFLKINILFFILASIIGRIARFALVGYITKTFGEYALSAFTKRFGLATVAVIAGVGVYGLMIFIKSV